MMLGCRYDSRLTTVYQGALGTPELPPLKVVNVNVAQWISFIISYYITVQHCGGASNPSSIRLSTKYYVTLPLVDTSPGV